MAILTAQQQSALDAWADAEPGPATAFFSGLNRKLGPADDADDLIRRFQRAQPGLWNELITSLIARYSATQSDVEREVGRAVLGTSPKIQRVAEDAGEVVDVASLEQNVARLRQLLEEAKADRDRLDQARREAIAARNAAQELARTEYARGLEDGAEAATKDQQRRNTAQALNAAIFNECSSASGCENNVGGGPAGTAAAIRLIEQLESAGFAVNPRDFTSVLRLLAEARRIGGQNLAYPSVQSIGLALQLLEN